MPTIDKRLFDTPEAVSLEAEQEVNGKKFREVEFQIYGELIEPSQLGKADKVEHQEQWSYKIEKGEKNAGHAVVRVRSINRGERYIRTTKTSTAEGGNFETENESSKDEFDQFMIFANSGMIKDRYSFDVDDRTYEVDVFCDVHGKQHSWVKIDLEIQELGEEELTREQMVEMLNLISLPELPVDLKNVIVIPPINRDPAKEKRVAELYDQYFLVGNYFLATDLERDAVEQPEEDVQPSEEGVVVQYEPVDADDQPNWEEAPEGATHYVVSEVDSVPTGWYQRSGIEGNKMFRHSGDGVFDELEFELVDYPVEKIRIFVSPEQWAKEQEALETQLNEAEVEQDA